MNIDKYKQDYLKDRLIKLVELEKKEILLIPKENNKAEYEYLKENGIVFINNLYYKKIPQDLSNEEIIMYSNIESSKNLIELVNYIKEIKKDQKEIKRDLLIIKIIIVISFIILLLILF